MTQLNQSVGWTNQLWQTLAGLFVAVAATALTVWIIHGTTLKGVAALIVVVGTVWFAATRNTQLALAVLTLYLGLLDGYLKLATGSSAVTFVRDAFLFALVFGILVRAVVLHVHLPLPPLGGWLVAFVVLVLIQFANPRAGTIIHSVAGARQHLEFIPLFFLAYAYVRTTRALRIFCILLAVIAAGNAAANWVQFNESPTQFAAWGPGYAQRVLGEGRFAGAGRTFAGGATGSATRPFGLGSDAGDGGVFCVLALCGILALVAFSKRKRDQLFAVAMALAAVVGIITSEGRGVIVSAVIAVIAFGFLTVTSRNRIASLLGVVLVVIASLIVVQSIVAAAGSADFRYAGLTPSSLLQTTSTARGDSIAAIPSNLRTYPFGAGLGTAGPAAGTTGASPTTLYGNVDTETEFSYLTVETGIPGMLALTGFTIAALLIGFTRCRSESDPEARVLLAALIAPVVSLLALFFSSPISSSVPDAPYLYAAAGIISYWLVERPRCRERPAPHAGTLQPAYPSPPARLPIRTPGRSVAQ